MNEEEWIEGIVARFGFPIAPGRVGVGDDCAVMTPTPGHSIVLTVDALVEGTHFRLPWVGGGAELGSRALRVSLSDLAAMAARPRGALISIESRELPGLVGEEFWAGVEATASEFGFEVLGGNVTRTPGPLSVATTLVGEVETGREVLRSGAEPGDELWVTGQPGNAARGRELLEQGRRGPEVDAFLRPEPRVGEALRLNAAGGLKAAIDISDGLGLDAARMMAASSCGAILDLSSLIHDAELALEGGEDYELLVALAPGTAPAGLTRVGTVRPEAGLEVRARGERVAYTPRGWDPFRSSST